MQVIQVYPSLLYWAVPAAHLTLARASILTAARASALASDRCAALKDLRCEVEIGTLMLPIIQQKISDETRTLYAMFGIDTIDMLRSDATVCTVLMSHVDQARALLTTAPATWPITRVPFNAVKLQKYYVNAVPHLDLAVGKTLLGLSFLKTKGCICDSNTYILPVEFERSAAMFASLKLLL